MNSMNPETASREEFLEHATGAPLETLEDEDVFEDAHRLVTDRPNARNRSEHAKEARLIHVGPVHFVRTLTTYSGLIH